MDLPGRLLEGKEFDGVTAEGGNPLMFQRLMSLINV